MENPVDLSELKFRLDMLERRVKELEAPEWPDREVASRFFEEFVRYCDFRNLQELIRVISISEWAVASVTLPLDLVEKIRNNISVNAWKDFVASSQQIENMWPVISRRQDILRVVRKLEKMGEISLPSEMRSLAIELREATPYSVPHRPREIDSEVKEWIDKVLPEAARKPRAKQTGWGGVEV